jgi:hypothetical protein
VFEGGLLGKGNRAGGELNGVVYPVGQSTDISLTNLDDQQFINPTKTGNSSLLAYSLTNVCIVCFNHFIKIVQEDFAKIDISAGDHWHF